MVEYLTANLTHTTSSTAIEDLRELCRNDSRRRLAYWYFQFNDKAAQSVCTMIKSFIRQLSPLPLPATTKQLWKDHNAAGSEPDIRELTDALGEIIGTLKREVFIVMDGLDECPQTSDQTEREGLLAHIRRLFGKHSTNLHILVTSRPEHDIHSELKSYPAVDIGKFVADDVRQFVKSALQSRELKHLKEDIKLETEERLLSTEER